MPFPRLNKLLPSAKNCDSNVVPLLHSETQVTSAQCVASCETRATVQDPTLSLYDSEYQMCLDEKGHQQSEKAPMPVSSIASGAMATVTQETDWNMLAQHLLSVLQQAIQSRIDRAPRVTPTVSQDTVTVGCGPPLDAGSVVLGGARVALLFSGGVDSVVLAALTDRLVHTPSWTSSFSLATGYEMTLFHRCLPPAEEIDLINVAFGQKNKDDEGR